MCTRCYYLNCQFGKLHLLLVAWNSGNSLNWNKVPLENSREHSFVAWYTYQFEIGFTLYGHKYSTVKSTIF